MADEALESDTPPRRSRLLLGGGVLIFGWLCPLFVPLVLASDLQEQLPRDDGQVRPRLH